MRSEKETLMVWRALIATLKVCACVCVCVWMVGCSAGGRIEASGSAEQVNQVMRETLDEWKSGIALSDFATEHPEVVVADEDWQVGAKLVDYKLVEPAVLNGSHWRQKVELQTKAKTKSKPTTVYYAVTLGEKTSILRSDFQF